MADLHRTKKQLALDREEEGDVGSYIIIAFMGRFKGETGEGYYLIKLASTMDSGTEVRKWIVLLIVSLENKGINNGFMLQDEEGKLVTILAIDVIVHGVS